MSFHASVYYPEHLIFSISVCLMKSTPNSRISYRFGNQWISRKSRSQAYVPNSLLKKLHVSISHEVGQWEWKLPIIYYCILPGTAALQRSKINNVLDVSKFPIFPTTWWHGFWHFFYLKVRFFFEKMVWDSSKIFIGVNCLTQ